jgi:metal-responsive CopG/Arc/MetJ family transcriptional regulator
MKEGTERFNERVQIALSSNLLEKVDDWRRRQPKIPTRSEALRRLVEVALAELDKT